jgi:hypothetical protein
VHPIAQAAASSGTGNAGAAVAVVIAVIAIWWLATHGKGTASARLIAWVLLPVVAWVLIAVASPAEAGRIATGTASGVAVAVGAFSRLAGAI